MGKSLNLCIPGLLAGSAVSPAFAQDKYDIVRSSCKADLQMSASACECIVAKAKTQLNEKETQFFIANISRDNNQMMALQQNLNANEAMNVMNFMTQTPTQCQAQ